MLRNAILVGGRCWYVQLAVVLAVGAIVHVLTRRCGSGVHKSHAYSSTCAHTLIQLRLHTYVTVAFARWHAEWYLCRWRVVL